MTYAKYTKHDILRDLNDYKKKGYNPCKKFTIKSNAMEMIDELMRLEKLRHIDELRKTCNKLIKIHKITQKQLIDYI